MCCPSSLVSSRVAPFFVFPVHLCRTIPDGFEDWDKDMGASVSRRLPNTSSSKAVPNVYLISHDISSHGKVGHGGVEGGEPVFSPPREVAQRLLLGKRGGKQANVEAVTPPRVEGFSVDAFAASPSFTVAKPKKLPPLTVRESPGDGRSGKTEITLSPSLLEVAPRGQEDGPTVIHIPVRALLRVAV